MYFEFVGSLMTFAFVMVCSKVNIKTMIFFTSGLMFLFFCQGQYIYIAFILGSVISRLCFDGYLRNKNGLLMHFLFIVSLIFLGFFEPASGFYSFLAKLDLNQSVLRAILHIFSSALILPYCIKYKTLKASLSLKMSLFIGKVSFPLYVIHIPIFFSLSSFVFVMFHGLGVKWSFLITLVVSLFVVLLVSYLLSIIDEMWCKLINKKTKALYSKIEISKLA